MLVMIGRDKRAKARKRALRNPAEIAMDNRIRDGLIAHIARLDGDISRLREKAKILESDAGREDLADTESESYQIWLSATPRWRDIKITRRNLLRAENEARELRKDLEKYN